jgi:CRP-like cAMP-binding protein
MAPVSQTAESQLLAVAKEVTEPKGTFLFRSGEPAFGIFLVKSGKVNLQLEGQQGQTLWKRTVTRNSIVGLPATLARGHYSLTAITLSKSQLAFVNTQDLIDLVKNDPCFGLELMRAVGDELLRMRATLGSSIAVK